MNDKPVLSFQRLDYWDVDVQAHLDLMLQQLESSQDLQALAWPLALAVPLADLTGSATYNSGGVFSGSDEQGATLQGVSMTFLLDLAAGSISNGRLLVLDGSDELWNVGFNGRVSGAMATMTDIDGTVANTRVVTGGAMQGYFIGNPLQPDIITGFQLQSGGDAVQGLTILRQ